MAIDSGRTGDFAVSPGRRRVLSLTLALVCLAALAGASPALAAEPWWHLSSGSRPSNLAPGSDGEVVVTAENVGDATVTGCPAVAAGAGKYINTACTVLAKKPVEGDYEKAPVTISDTLPPGLRVLGVAGAQPAYGGAPGETIPLPCSESASQVSCESVFPALAPYDLIEVRIEVEVLPSAKAEEVNTVSAFGGGPPQPSAQLSRPLRISDEPTPFGIEDYELGVEAEGGGTVTQAGSHPFQVTGTIALNQGPDTAPLGSGPQAGPAVYAKNIVARLPPGLIADPTPVGRCSQEQFERHFAAEGLPSVQEDECPATAAVGVASVTVDVPGGPGTLTFAAPVFNIEPAAGEPARFGFLVPFADVPVVLDTGVRSGPGEDWGVDLSTVEVPQNVGFISARVTFWGVPERVVHDGSRGWGCLAAARGHVSYEHCEQRVEERDPPAFVTLPTSCTGPLVSSIEADSWAAPGVFQTFAPSEPLPALTGCSEVAFTPGIEVQTTTHSAASPSGFSFDLNFDDEGLLKAGTLTQLTQPNPPVAQSDLKDTVVSLPEGLTIDPSAGVGLGACTAAEYAEMTLSSPTGVGCPEDAELGTVSIETPLLSTTVDGSLYVAQPYENPFPEPGHPGGSLLALYVVARSLAERGVLVKLAGRVTPNPVTGQLTVTFENDPQLPFAHFDFHFREGEQAPLITPATCGTYETKALFTPWSEPLSSLPDASSFQITSGSEGSACPGALPPFAPVIATSTVTGEAGVFSPFYVELSRTDAMSEIASYSATLPLGLTADLSGVPFCPQADIELAKTKTGTQEENEPSCPAASLIGHSLVGTGVGPILDYVPGKLYLAGAFHGDPFSVVSVTSAVIGPFDLGTVVIRFGLEINPYTAQVSINPTGSEPIPTILDGIVTHVRDIRVSVDRSGFTIDPTNCEPLPVSSTLTSTLGQTAMISTPFHAEGCSELKFKPQFAASTSAQTSKARGASLRVKLTMPGELGAQLGANANVKEVKVELPKQLPSRLTTLQQACTDAQFQANPAGCPAASMIGYAKATTPIIPVPLTGPVVFVSHGGEAFPSLVMVLQGYGVTIDLVGSTFVSPQGITSTTFKAVPDEPVGSFEMTLPEGRYSALAANGDLCKSAYAKTVTERVELRRHGHLVRRHGRVVYIERKIKRAGLIMPTKFIAQNGTTVSQNTEIAVVGCHSTHHAAHRAHRGHDRSTGGKRRK